jgi:hypothetical protein
MKHVFLVIAASAAFAGSAQATTNAGSVPAASEFVDMSNVELFARITDIQFGNGRTMQIGMTREPGLTSGGFVPTDLTSGGPLAGVPEPTAWTMLIAGFAMIGLLARRRKAAIAA